MTTPGPYDLPLSTLDDQEAQTILYAFNSDIAYEIGTLLRNRAREHPSPVLIQVSSTSGVVFFQACSRPGVIPDNAEWVARKRASVARFHRSTFYLGCKLRHEGRTVAGAFYIDEGQFSVHGGGFPIRVRGIEGISGVIVVSGLPQHVDHDLIYKTLIEYKESLAKADPPAISEKGISQ